MSERVSSLPVGDLVSKIRRLSGLSQEELAGHLGMRQSQVSKMETGARNVLASELLAVVAVSGRHFTAVIGDMAEIEIGPPGAAVTFEIVLGLEDRDVC